MTTFSFGTDPSSELGEALVPAMKGGRIEVMPDTVRVTMGDPPMFDAEIARDRIKSADRAPDLTRPTRGVHGGRGKWLVNRTGTNLVRLTLDPPVPAAFRGSDLTLPAEPKGRFVQGFVRWMLRDRTLQVRELTISVDSPDDFIAAVTRRPAAAS